MQRRAAEPVVAEDAVAGAAVRDLERGLQAELLEGADLLGRRAVHLLELHPVVEGEDPHLRPVAAMLALPVGRPVHLLQRRVVPEVGADDAAAEEELELGQRRIGRGAAVARDREGAAGVGELQARRPVLRR